MTLISLIKFLMEIEGDSDSSAIYSGSVLRGQDGSSSLIPGLGGTGARSDRAGQAPQSGGAAGSSLAGGNGTSLGDKVAAGGPYNLLFIQPLI